MPHNKVIDCVVKIHGKDKFGKAKTTGTGFFVHPEGYIMTCNHVVDKLDPKTLCVSYKSKCHPVKINRTFPDEDIVVLKGNVKTKNWMPLKRGFELEERVFIYGFQDLDSGFTGVPLTGSIKGPARFGAGKNKRMLIKIGRIDIKSGMSGAPVCSIKDKKIVGIINLAFQERGVGFATPSEDIFRNWGWLERENEKQISANRHELLKRTVAYYFRLTNHGVESDIPINTLYKADMIVAYNDPVSGTFTKTLVNCIYKSGKDRVDKARIKETAVMGDLAKIEYNVNHLLIVTNGSFSRSAETMAKEKGIICRTLKQLENNLIDFDHYIDNLIMSYELDELSNQYIELKIKKGFFENGDTLFLKDIINDKWSKRENRDNSFIIVLGEYGTGKTSFCRKIAHDFAYKYKNDPGQYRIPILFNLKPYSKALDIRQVTTTTLVKDCNVTLTDDKLFEMMNKGGSFVLLFDGFNEMALRLTPSEAIANFKQLATTFSNNTKVIITCRTEYLDTFQQIKEELTETELYSAGSEPKFEIIQLKELDADAIREYLEKKDAGMWENYWNFIHNNDHLLELSRRPFFLEMISQIIPRIEEDMTLGNDKGFNIGKLMHLYIKEVFSKWHTKEFDSWNLSDEEKFFLLSEIGYYMILENKMALEYNEIRKIIEKHLPELNRILSTQYRVNALRRNPEEIDSYCRDLLSRSILKGRFGYGQAEIGPHMAEFSHFCFFYFFSAKKFFKAVIENNPEVFNIQFVGAETILLVKDFILMDKNLNEYRDRLSAWLGIKNHNIQKYATLFLAFIGNDQSTKLIKKKIEDMYGELKLPERLELVYETEQDRIDHLKLHAILSLSQHGSKDYTCELIRILFFDPDYTHRWYALLGVENICLRDKKYIYTFYDALNCIIDDNNEKPELKRLTIKILNTSIPDYINQNKIKSIRLEKRKHKRYPICKKVNISCAGKNNDAVLMNISKSGALLKSSKEIEQDKAFELIIHDKIRIPSEIIRYNKKIIHVKFQNNKKWKQINAFFQLEPFPLLQKAS